MSNTEVMLDLYRQLFMAGLESEESDSIRDQMDVVWYRMSDEEISKLRMEVRKMMNEVNTSEFKTSFGMYAAVDYETYRKLKVIKSTFNVSSLKARRYDKWGFKSEHNRSKNKPELCDVFHQEEDGEHTSYVWNRQTYKFDTQVRMIAQYKNTGNGEEILQVWARAKRVVATPDKVRKVNLDVLPMSLEELYQACLPYYQKHCLRK